jgi:hypothetical protein
MNKGYIREQSKQKMPKNAQKVINYEIFWLASQRLNTRK